MKLLVLEMSEKEQKFVPFSYSFIIHPISVLEMMVMSGEFELFTGIYLVFISVRSSLFIRLNGVHTKG